MRAVSVLEVADVAVWAELDAVAPGIGAWLGASLSPTRRIVTDERALLDAVGERILVRYARRTAAEAEAVREDLRHRIGALPGRVLRILHAAQRHALDGEVLGRLAWDPEHDAGAVRHLQGVGLIEAVARDGDVSGRYRLHPDLPPPPAVPYDLEEAVMGETDDLPEPGPGPIALLHDLAALAAAFDHVTARRTLAGPVARADARRLGRWLGARDLAETGDLDGTARWSRALRGLEALGVVSMDPIARTLHLDLGLERVLSGDDADACDRLVHRLLDRDLHVVVPAIRAALAAAGDGAIDEVVFLDLLREQHREILFPRWSRGGVAVYPTVPGEAPRPFDDDGWDAVEVPMIGAALARCARLGLIRRAPGVFAATPDGRRWAGAGSLQRPPIWVAGDLEVVVPPDAITPWERFQLERLGRCLQRDVVDRYRLERDGVASWLATHDLDEALSLLERRCPGVPSAVVETLTGWARGATRITLTRGILLHDVAPGPG